MSLEGWHEKRCSLTCSAKGIVKHHMGAEAGIHWQDCCKNCCCTAPPPPHYYCAPHSAALLQSNVKIQLVVIYIHFVCMWVTTEGKAQQRVWPKAGQMFIVLLRKHQHQVNSADSGLFKCFCVDFTLLQPIDYDYFLNGKIKFDACSHACIFTIILVFCLFYGDWNYQVIYICISAGNQLAVSLMIPAHLWKGQRSITCTVARKIKGSTRTQNCS